MKNKYTNLFKSMLKSLERNGHSAIVNHCKYSPELGKTPKDREFNSWVYILGSFAELCSKAESQDEYTRMLGITVGIYFDIPMQYRKKVYNQVNAELGKKGLSFTCEPIGRAY